MPWLFLAVVEIKKCLIKVETQTRVNYFSTEFWETGQFWSGDILTRRRTLQSDPLEQRFQVFPLGGGGLVQPGQHVAQVPTRTDHVNSIPPGRREANFNTSGTQAPAIMGHHVSFPLQRQQRCIACYIMLAKTTGVKQIDCV